MTVTSVIILSKQFQIISHIPNLETFLGVCDFEPANNFEKTSLEITL